MNTLLIRADASSMIGAGHLMRCLALAQACKVHSIEPVFVLALETPLAERLKSEGMEVLFIDAKRGTEEDAAELAKIALLRKCQWIILDGYDFDVSYQQAIRAAGFKLFVIDDYAHLPKYDCDILFNQNIDASPKMYEGKIVRQAHHEPDTQFLLGPTFALLRQEYLHFSQSEKFIPETALKILVTLGGGDSGGATAKVIEALVRIPLPLDIQCIVGSGEPFREELQVLKSHTSHRIVFSEVVTDMADRLAWADIAVSASGSTCWELLYMGVPFVSGILAENQAGIAGELEKQHLALNVGWYRDCSIEKLALTIETLISNPSLRRQFSLASQRVVDGKGAERVVKVMEDM